MRTEPIPGSVVRKSFELFSVSEREILQAEIPLFKGLDG